MIGDVKISMEIQGAENTVLPLLKKQYAETQKGIDNLVNAIQQGIITPSTKERLEELEKQKNELSVQIIKEEMAKPTLTRDQIIFWFHRFRKYNVKRLDHRRRLIDSFVNSIYLYDDKMIINFNYKEGSKTVTFADIEESGLCSDLTAFAQVVMRKAKTPTTYPLPPLINFQTGLSRRRNIAKAIIIDSVISGEKK